MPRPARGPRALRRQPCSIREPDYRDLVPDRPATRQRPARVAEEAGLVLQRVHRDAGHRGPGGLQPSNAIPRQVELPARLAPAGGEEPDVGGVARDYRVAQGGAALVSLLPAVWASNDGGPP